MVHCWEEVTMIDKVQETHLYKWLCEKNSEFLGQVNEAIRYAETMLPLFIFINVVRCTGEIFITVRMRIETGGLLWHQ